MKKNPTKEWWQSAAADYTLASGFTYNVRAVTTPGDSANPTTLPAINGAQFFRLRRP